MKFVGMVAQRCGVCLPLRPELWIAKCALYTLTLLQLQLQSWIEDISEISEYRATSVADHQLPAQTRTDNSRAGSLGGFLPPTPATRQGQLLATTTRKRDPHILQSVSEVQLHYLRRL